MLSVRGGFLIALLCPFGWPGVLAASPTQASGQADLAVHQAQIEARILFPPRAVRGSDGVRHLAYELRISSFQDEDDPLNLVQVALFADRSTIPLKVVKGDALFGLTAGQSKGRVASEGVPIASGKSITLFLWVALPPGARPRTLRHQLSLRTRKGTLQAADNFQTPVLEADPIQIAPPLRGGPWLAVEGPGNHLSHHWGGSVALNGSLTVPQRFATDWFKLDERNHSLRGAHGALASTVDEDWLGYDQEVLAVSDGVVVDARDGIPNGKPLAPQETPQDLTARNLYGNFVVLRVAPGVYAHYAHLKTGSVKVRAGQHVRRGTIIGRLGQTGAAGAPHLHFHISNKPIFETSEGIPFIIGSFTRVGRTTIGDTFDSTRSADLARPSPRKARLELPLDGDIVLFR
jgi:hypothetical protein